MSVEPLWLELAVIVAAHEEQLAEHGGASGIRDNGALESAAARPRNSWSYGQTDLLSLAAGYAFGIARNHPFVDGNKRTAFVAAVSFLAINGIELRIRRESGVTTFLALAAGELGEEDLADWFRQHLVER